MGPEPTTSSLGSRNAPILDAPQVSVQANSWRMLYCAVNLADGFRENSKTLFERCEGMRTIYERAIRFWIVREI